MLDEEPQVSALGSLVLLAWRDLQGERHVGMSLGLIPWRAIAAWCDRYEVSDAEEVIEIVQRVDADWINETLTENQNAGGRH